MIPFSENTLYKSADAPWREQAFGSAGSHSFFGRQQELSLLGRWLKHASHDNVSLIQVEGEAGLGKTSLIQQLCRQYTTVKTFFLYGKNEQRIEKIPYFSIKLALRQWMDILLTLQDKEYDSLKQAVRQSVGSHHQVLTAVFEELNLLFRKSEADAAMFNADPQRMQQQLTYYFYRFLLGLSQCGYTTVLFLDDLQWADSASLQLLQDLLQLYDVPDFVVIVSNRPLQPDTEQGRLLQLLHHEKVRKLTLSPMDKNTISCFVPEAWQLQQEEKLAFEEYLMQESGGNPLFAMELIEYITHEQLIYKEPEASHVIHWKRLPRLHQNENSISLVLHKLAQLSPESQQTVAMAACLGYSFSENILFALLQGSEDSFQQCMRELEQQNFVLKQGEIWYFIHDNIHTAVYSSLQKLKLFKHLQIGDFLARISNMDVEHPYFFDMVNHYNLAAEVVNEPRKRNQLALLNWLAARLARQKSAFDRALDYYSHCQKLLTTDALRNHALLQTEGMEKAANKLHHTYSYHQLYLSCLIGIAECQFLTQHFEPSLQTLSGVFTITQDRFTLLQAYTIQMKICIAVFNRQDTPHLMLNGTQITEQVLQQYQIALPQTEADFLPGLSRLYEEVKQLLLQHDTQWYLEQDIQNDREYNDLVNFIVSALPLLFFVDVKKAKYLGLAGLHLCLNKGFTPVAPAFFAASVWAISVLDKDDEVGKRMGEISLKLVEQERYRSVAHIVYHLATLNFYNWQHAYCESIQKMDEATQLAFEAGDYNYVVFCATNARLLEIFAGKNLKEHLYSMMRHKFRGLHVYFVNRSNFTFISYLTGKKPGFLSGRFTFPKSLVLETECNANKLYHLHHVKEKLFYLSSNYRKAYQQGRVCERLIHVYEGFQVGLEHNFFYCLILFQMIQRYPGRKAAYMGIILRKWKELDRLAAMGSGNYLHKKYLLEAEMARCNQREMEVLTLYDQTIAEAQRTGFINVAAIAAEQAGSFLLSLDKERLSVPYLKEAYAYYRQWGADAKLRWLEKHYPAILKDEIQQVRREAEVYLQTGSTLTDMTVVYQTAMAISRELKLNDLIHTLLQIAMSHIQSDRGVFILKENGACMIKAEGKLQQITLRSEPLNEDTAGLPLKLINYVLRKKEKMWVQDVPHDKMFGNEPYFLQSRVRAAVCLPVLHHQEIVGILYLEKSAEGGIFYTSPMQVLDTIASQAGISLTNALMYQDLQRLNEELQRQEKIRVQAIIETQEKERKRVAEELHDNLGQMLSLVKLNFSRLEYYGKDNQQLYHETSQLLDESCMEVRRIAHNIMPPDFEKKSLAEILESLLRKNLTYRGLQYCCNCYHLPADIPVAVKLNLYRVIQEIVQNTIKHAQARKISLQLIGSEHGLDVMVEDDGKGFDTDSAADGLGLHNIYSRINSLKGSVEVDSSLQRGTIYNIHLPLSQQ